MSSWKQLATGSYGFAHSDNGTQLSPSESFERMRDRLVHTDPDLRMPLGKYMATADLDALYLWLSQQIEKGRP